MQRFAWRRCLRVGVIVVGLGGALLALTGWLYARFNEQVEHHLFKGSTLHSFWNTHSHDMGKARSRAAGEPLKVFLHVPRTSGDAMQTHLFGPIPNTASKIWPSEYSQALAANNQSSFLSADARRGVGVRHLLRDGHIRSEQFPLVTLKGFYGRRDWQALEVDPRVGFTFLRHPVERVLSLMFFLLDNPEHSDPEDFFDTIRGQLKLATRNSTVASVGTATHDVIQYLCSFVKNSVTWQMADTQHCSRRDTTLGRNETAVLNLAKDTLRQMTFVGFYETLHRDFWRLKQELYHDHHEVPWYMPWAFQIGTFLALPRLQTLKFSAVVPPDIVAQIEDLTRLDMELYTWAVDTFSTPMPRPELFPSFSSFFQAHAMQTAVVVVTLVILILGIVRCCCCCCCSRLASFGTKPNGGYRLVDTEARAI